MRRGKMAWISLVSFLILICGITLSIFTNNIGFGFVAMSITALVDGVLCRHIAQRLSYAIIAAVMLFSALDSFKIISFDLQRVSLNITIPSLILLAFLMLYGLSQNNKETN